MADDDTRTFREEMDDVRRLEDDDRVRPGPVRQRLAQQSRRQAATTESSDPNPLTLPDEVPRLDPHDITGEKKSGVQEGVYRKMRLGKYRIDAKLDLHRVTLAEARDRVQAFLRQAHEGGQRTVLITHGKGVHSPTPARLKSYVFHWMAESELVLAWHSAQPQHGGAGATYVMVRKSPAQSRENRQAHDSGFAKHPGPSR